jgi:hypothetical protein
MEKGFKIQVSARNTKDEVLEENLWLLVDNLPPTFKIQPKILGCGEVRLEILASEKLTGLSAHLLLENTRIPLQFSTKDGAKFGAMLKTPVGVEETANLFIENARDLVGNCPIENVLLTKTDTIPPRVENCWLERGGRVIARGKIQDQNSTIMTSETRPEILIALSDGSGIGDWELNIVPVVDAFEIGEVRAPECEKVFNNGIMRVIPKGQFRFGNTTFYSGLEIGQAHRTRHEST